MRDDRTQSPTETAMGELQTAYDFYNVELFDSELPSCLITLQRKEHRVLGYFHRERFGSTDGGQTTDEIAMNPMHFLNRSVQDTLSTLVHEMCHLWQYRCTPKSAHPKKANYHNEGWAAKMESIGLMPSNTGLPNGKKKGYQMTHFVILEGPFDIATQELLSTGFGISWYDRLAVEVKADKPRKKSVVVAPPGTKPGEAIKLEPGQRRKFSCPASVRRHGL